MGVQAIKEVLENNPEKIVKLLEQSGFYHISISKGGKEIRCGVWEGGNKTSVRINCENLSAICYSRDIKGDIIALIQKHNELTFLQTIDFICDVLHIKNNKAEKPKALFRRLL